MNTAMIGPRTGIEDPQAAGERLSTPGPQQPADARGTAASGVASGAASTATDALRGPARAGDASRRAEGESRKLQQAAEEFESLLLAQILRTAREAGSGGWLGSSESQEMSTTMELAETQLARAMAQSGALGITKLLAGELPADSAREAGEPTADAAGKIKAALVERGQR